MAPAALVDSPARVFSKVFCVILKIFGADAVDKCRCKAIQAHTPLNTKGV
ncbi:MAG: hypothetical protein IJD28_02535 [Deferribacterales bacterium]|nr:hypothetical protein [Deferribacterales bacterium]